MPEMKLMSSLLLCAIAFLVLNLPASITGTNQFVYNGFAGVNLTLDGNAVVTPDGLLELTNDTVNLGHAFHPRFSVSRY
jgi:hypothetical protein